MPTKTESGSSLLDLSDLSDLAELLIGKNSNVWSPNVNIYLQIIQRLQLSILHRYVVSGNLT